MVPVNSFHHPESPIKLEQRNVRIILDKKELGIGTLYVSERTFCWNGSNNVGFSIGYQNISLHAVSRDAIVYPQDCVYMILDPHIYMPGDAPPPRNEDDESSEDEDSEPNVSELIIVPENPLVVVQIYDALALCQALNPDPNDVDDDDDDNLYVDAEDEMEEGHYNIDPEIGAGDADVDELSLRMEDSLATSIDIHYNYRNGSANEEEEFEDAD